MYAQKSPENILNLNTGLIREGLSWALSQFSETGRGIYFFSNAQFSTNIARQRNDKISNSKEKINLNTLTLKKLKF